MAVPKKITTAPNGDRIEYDATTPEAIVSILEDHRRRFREARGRPTPRLRIHYGDTKTGRDWMDEYSVEGYIGTSTGTVKIPLVIYNARSMGGGAVLTGAIVRIRTTGKHGTDLYRHPRYHLDPKNGRLNAYTERELDRHWPDWRTDKRFAAAVAARRARGAA